MNHLASPLHLVGPPSKAERSLVEHLQGIALFTHFKDLTKNQCGGAALEYGLISALVGAAALVGAQSMGSSLDDALSANSAAMQTAYADTSSASGSGKKIKWPSGRSHYDLP